MTVDQWALSALRTSEAAGAAAGNRVYLYEVPPGTPMPYLHLQLVSGVRQARTQSLRYAGTTRFQIDYYGNDRYAGREAIEAVMRTFSITSLRTAGLRIEGIETAGPRNLPSEEGFRFSCDITISWVVEEE